MGKLRYFDVTFNNPQGVFQAGESVHGNVVVDFADSIKLRSKCSVGIVVVAGSLVLSNFAPIVPLCLPYTHLFNPILY